MRRCSYLVLFHFSMILVSQSFARDVSGTNRQQNFRRGLVAHYYRDVRYWGGNWTATLPPKVDPVSWTFSQYAYSRVEPIVNHTYVKRGWFSVRWQGYLDVINDTTATYTFHIWAQDGCRLMIDDEQVIDSWKHITSDNPESRRTGQMELGPGKHRIRIEYFLGLNSDDARQYPVKLIWACQSQGGAKSIVPAHHFSHAVSDLVPMPGLKD